VGFAKRGWGGGITPIRRAGEIEAVLVMIEVERRRVEDIEPGGRWWGGAGDCNKGESKGKRKT
jgi:hypothetical protein